MPRGKHSGHLRGSSHPRWNHGKILSDEGYVKVRVGIGHPLADPNGYAYEHLVVWTSAGMSLPRAGELIHHKNEDKEDNRFENLELKSRGAHNALHNSERGRDEEGRFLSSAGRLLDGREWNEFPEVSRG